MPHKTKNHNCQRNTVLINENYSFILVKRVQDIFVGKVTHFKG